MSEPVQFWLENKMSAGIKVASIGNQALVVYRERYYVIEKDAAQMKGGRPLRYSLSSMPLIWKKALRGDVLPEDALMVPADDALPVPTATKRERVKKERTPAAEPALPNAGQAVPAPVLAKPPTQTRPAVAAKAAGNVRPTDIKPAVQMSVSTNCPECRFKHELPLDKGKNGKPFIMTCAKCSAEFAVRFVPVMVYQAQVAGFR
ncbi:MAG: hypothetical protein JJE30_14495 [Desulfuromonadales bacterium]|nr:hypothetical protein [Desulfuromonadales bacterium]